MEPLSQWPIACATHVLKKLLMTELSKNKTPVKDFAVSTDHPNNIGEQEHPILNIYPLLINECNFLKNVSPLNEQNSRQGYALNVHFLLSATGDYAELKPHILLDSAIKILKVSPILELGNNNYTLQIMPAPMNIEEATTIWSTLKCPHRINIIVLVKITNND
jgi:hypothetical protein